MKALDHAVQGLCFVGFEMGLIGCAEALGAVLERRESPGLSRRIDRVALGESLGRVLAEGVRADRDQPPFARSTRDGFAVHCGEIQGDLTVNHGALTVLGTVRAGEVWTGARIGPRECVEIMTGAPLPEGTDAVAMVEHVRRVSDHEPGTEMGGQRSSDELVEQIEVEAGRSLRRGENVVAQGSEARAGEELIAAGTRLGPAEVALAASLGYAELDVFVRPRVAVLATGDELVDVSETPLPHQIRNSNSHGIAALCALAGAEALLAAPVADEMGALERALVDAREADVMVLSGGVSAGKYDLVETALERMRAEFLFTGVRMQPGKPVVFGRLPAWEGRPAMYFFGLPGNPISTQVTFRLFVDPLLRAMGGQRGTAPVFVQATLAREVSVKPGLTRFLPGLLSGSLGVTSVELTGWQGSGDLASNARANCYVVVPEDAERLEAGAVVQVLMQ